MAMCLPFVNVLADSTLRVENTNFLLRQPDIYNTTDYTYDYNRLRLRYDYVDDAGFFATAIGDGVNYLGAAYTQSPDFEYVSLVQPDIPFKTATVVHPYNGGAAYAKLHRLYGGVERGRHRVSVGVQKISMGVGRIWTPTDLYNSKNSYALEPDEVFGVLACDYTYALSDLSTLEAVASMRRDHTMKYAGRYKGYLEIADVGIDLIHSVETDMIGYELEGNLFSTGAEWRSEGGWYRNTPMDAEFFQGILGVDYGFENGVNVAVEGLYSSQTFTYEALLANYDSEIINNMVLSPFYLGATLSYDMSLAFSGSLLYIESFNDANSRFVAPVLNYTFNDYNLFSLGAMLNFGSAKSEFGAYGNTGYLKWQFSY